MEFIVASQVWFIQENPTLSSYRSIRIYIHDIRDNWTANWLQNPFFIHSFDSGNQMESHNLNDYNNNNNHFHEYFTSKLQFW